MKKVFDEIEGINGLELYDTNTKFRAKFPTTSKLFELFGRHFHGEIDSDLVTTLSALENTA